MAKYVVPFFASLVLFAGSMIFFAAPVGANEESPADDDSALVSDDGDQAAFVSADKKKKGKKKGKKGRKKGKGKGKGKSKKKKTDDTVEIAVTPQVLEVEFISTRPRNVVVASVDANAIRFRPMRVA